MVVEVYELDLNLSYTKNVAQLLVSVQHYLDLLFTLPEEFRYNFAKVAEAPFIGLTHSEESKEQMSLSHRGNTRRRGKNHSPETRQQMSESKSDLNNPMYGRSGVKSPTYGKTHSSKTLKLMSVA